MNKIKSIFTIIIIILASSVFSQVKGDYIDVLHLKDGATIKGIITEQIPSVSVTILTIDGNKTTYPYSQIEKFSSVLADKQFIKKSKQLKRETAWINTFKRKEKGYFIDAELLIGKVAAEVRLTNGYKFGRFGRLGLAVGFGGVIVGETDGISQLMLNIIYSGDLLDKRFTPYYEAEIGYGIVVGDRKRDEANIGRGIFGRREIVYPLEAIQTLNFGGPKGALAFGVKMKTKKRIIIKFAVDYRVSGNFFDMQESVILENGNVILFNKTQKGLFRLDGGIGLRFGVGF